MLCSGKELVDVYVLHTRRKLVNLVGGGGRGGFPCTYNLTILDHIGRAMAFCGLVSPLANF